MFGKQEVKAFLDEKGLKYEWIEHEAVYTIEDMVRLGLEGNKDVAKNLFLRDQKGKRHFLVVIRADKQANLKELGEKLLLSRTTLRSEGDLFLCGMTPAELEEQLGVEICFTEQDGGAFLENLLGI